MINQQFTINNKKIKIPYNYNNRYLYDKYLNDRYLNDDNLLLIFSYLIN